MGATGATGQPGRSALTPLQAGETIVGYVSFLFQSYTGGLTWRASDSYPIPLPDLPDNMWVDGVTPGENCGGSFAEPTAPANSLCLYSVVPFPDAHIVDANKLGFSVSWLAPDAGLTGVSATWAYTEG